MVRKWKLRIIGVVAIFVLILSGCGESHIEVYTRNLDSDMSINKQFEHCINCEVNEEVASEFRGVGRLSVRWEREIENVGLYSATNSPVSISDGWVVPYITLEPLDVENKLINPETGDIVNDDFDECFGSFDSMFDIVGASYAPIQKFKVNEDTVVLVTDKAYFIDCNTKKVVSKNMQTPHYFRLSDKNLYYFFGAMNDDKRDVFKRELDDITTQTTIGEYNNVFVLGNQIWLQDGLTLKKYDESKDRFTESVNVSGLISTNEQEYIELLGFDYYEDHILGYVADIVSVNSMFDSDYLIGWADETKMSDVLRYIVPNEHSFPMTYIPQMSPSGLSENIKFYFLLNPEKPDDVVYLREDILEQNYAIIRVLGSHFIIENETELKCVDPFTGETKWYISREDAGANSRILWVDERGVLVQSMTNESLYCFE